MKKNFLLALLIISSACLAFRANAVEVVMAIPDFNIRVPGLPITYGENLVNELRPNLVQNPGISVVERDRLVEILNDWKLSPGEPIDQNKAIKLGQMLQANYVVLGEIYELFGDTTLSVRLVDIQHRKIHSEYALKVCLRKNVKNLSSGISNAMKEIAGKILSDIGRADFFFESPGAGHPYPLGPLSTSGTHNLSVDSHVWLILDDGYGFYPQNANIYLQADGSWSNQGVNLGRGIIAIHAVLVNESGHKFFRDKVQNNDWAQFKVLPDGYRILASVKIATVDRP